MKRGLLAYHQLESLLILLKLLPVKFKQVVFKVEFLLLQVLLLLLVLLYPLQDAFGFVVSHKFLQLLLLIPQLYVFLKLLPVTMIVDCFF
jgi:hypothetical protein